MKEYTPELPKSVGIWKRSDSPMIVDSSNIFDYMNGAGELYLAYRFKKLEVFQYKSIDENNIVVELYFMETSDDSFGLISQDWDGEPVDSILSNQITPKVSQAPTTRAIYGAGLLRIASGNIYARIIAYEGTPQSKKAIMLLGRSIVKDDRYPNEPGILNILPTEVMNEWKLQSNEICYFRSHLVLNSFYYLSYKNILNLEYSSEAVTALYENKANPEKTNPIRVLFVKYANPKKASQALDMFCMDYFPEHEIKKFNPTKKAYSKFFKVEDGWLGYRLEKDYLAFVFQCPDEKSARFVLNSITFNIPETGEGYAK